MKKLISILAFIVPTLCTAQQTIAPFQTPYGNFTQGIQFNGSFGSANQCWTSTGTGSQWGACPGGLAGVAADGLSPAGIIVQGAVSQPTGPSRANIGLTALFLGTSIDCGQYSSNPVCLSNTGRTDLPNAGAWTDWTSYLLTMSSLKGRAIAKWNYAVPGYTIAAMASHWTVTPVVGLTAPHTIAAAAGSSCLAFVGAPANDVYVIVDAATLASTEAAEAALWALAKADGCRVVAFTTMPRNAGDGNPAHVTGSESYQVFPWRIPYNDWVRAQKAAGSYDTLIDIAAHFPVNTDANFFYDGTHPNAVGQYEFATYVNSQIWADSDPAPTLQPMFSASSFPFQPASTPTTFPTINQTISLAGAGYALPAASGAVIPAGTTYFLFNNSSTTASTITASCGGCDANGYVVNPFSGVFVTVDNLGSWWTGAGPQQGFPYKLTNTPGCQNQTLGASSGAITLPTCPSGVTYFIFNFSSTVAITLASAGGGPANNLVVPQNSGLPVVSGGSGVWYVAGSPAPQIGVSGSLGGGALAAGACSTIGVNTFTNLGFANQVSVSPANPYPGDGFWWEGYVTSGTNVNVKICASIAGTPTATTYNVRVTK